MKTTYTGQTLTNDDLDDNESGSTFTNCTFNLDGGGKNIRNKNFSFALFDGCTFNAKFEECNLTGIEGNSKPVAGDTLESNLNPGSGAWGDRATFIA